MDSTTETHKVKAQGCSPSDEVEGFFWVTIDMVSLVRPWVGYIWRTFRVFYHKPYRKFLLSSCHAVNEMIRPSAQVQHSHKCHVFGYKVGICHSFLPRVKNVSRLHCWVSSWVSCDTIKYLSKRLDSKQQDAVSGSFTWEAERDTEKTEMGIAFHMCFLWSVFLFGISRGEKTSWPSEASLSP